VSRPASRVLLGGVLALLVAAGACTQAPAPRSPDRSAAPLRLDASVTQFRFDEGTRRLKAGVVNDGERAVRVTQATIAWDGLTFPTVPLSDEPVPPGQAAAFTIAYGAPHCGRPPAGTPVLVAVVDGRRRRLPLRVEDPGLLRRLQAKACAQQRLDRQVGVDLRPATRTRRIGGEEYLPADLVLRRRPGAHTPVTLVDLGGSVLIDLTPRAGRRALPFRMAGDRQRLSVPLLLGSAHRCDAHALGQSSQTYLLSAYLRLAGRPTQRQILPLTSAERDRIIGVVDRDCH
jgi:hypothetical protein